MTQIYEAMYLLDNQVVRTDWKKAKAIIADTLTKHGGTIHTLRRWEEKRLAYPINKTNRATYYLAHYELPIENISATLREFDLSESVMRYLVLAVDEVPEEERKLAALEEDADYVVPEPPADDATDDDPEEGGDGEKSDGEKSDGEKSDGEKSDGEKSDGEKSKGDKSKGDKSDGEKAKGDKSDGEKADGEKAEGEKADGEKAEGEKAEAAAESEEAPKADDAVAAKTEGADAPKES